MLNTRMTEIDWNVENEIQLFYAMMGHKPVGEYVVVTLWLCLCLSVVVRCMTSTTLVYDGLIICSRE